MTTIALWISVCADDWAAELAKVKASNDVIFYKRYSILYTFKKIFQYNK